jgi:hypothetical protein
LYCVDAVEQPASRNTTAIRSTNFSGSLINYITDQEAAQHGTAGNPNQAKMDAQGSKGGTTLI